MESILIKSKHINDGILEIFEFSDMSGDIISYLVTKAHKGQNVSSGAAKIEEVSFSNREDAIIFFNNQD